MSAISHAADPPIERLTVAGTLVLGLGALDFGLEQSIIIPALPALAKHYDASLVDVGWLATAFVLASVVAVPLLGRLGDIFGKRRMVLVALGAFAVGSLICALTHSVGFAIAGRAVQGAGAAIPPLTYALARDTLPPAQLSRAIGAVVGMSGAGGAIGLLLSGIVVDHSSPAGIFWLLFAIAILLAGGVYALVPESRVRAAVPLDLAGSALLAVGLAALLLGISKGTTWGWMSGRVLGLFAVAAIVLSVFGVVERRVRQPLVDLALVVTRPFANANACAFAFGYSFFVAIFLVPQIAASDASYGLGLTTLEIGLLLVPTGLASIAGGWLGGRLVDVIGARRLVALGAATGVVAYVSLALAHSAVAPLSTGSALLGFAWGLILTGIYPVVIGGVGVEKTTVAIAVNVVLRNTAVSLGTTAAFALVTGAGLAGGFPAESGYTRAFLMCAVGSALLVVLAALLPARLSPR